MCSKMFYGHKVSPYLILAPRERIFSAEWQQEAFRILGGAFISKWVTPGPSEGWQETSNHGCLLVGLLGQTGTPTIDTYTEHSLLSSWRTSISSHFSERNYACIWTIHITKMSLKLDLVLAIKTALEIDFLSLDWKKWRHEEQHFTDNYLEKQHFADLKAISRTQLHGIHRSSTHSGLIPHPPSPTLPTTGSTQNAFGSTSNFYIFKCNWIS